MPAPSASWWNDETPSPFCLTAVLWAAFSWPVEAQQSQCQPRDSVISLLANKYKEAPVAVGVTNTGGLVEVLSTGDGNTWTIIVTTPQGLSCLVASGEGWQQRRHSEPGEGT